MNDEIFVIWNPSAGSTEQNAALRAELERHRHVTLHETASAQHARELAAEAVQRRAGLVVAAGGDGTVNAVVNGLTADLENARLAVLPLGTGNDLCRTLAVPPDPAAAARLLIPEHLDRSDATFGAGLLTPPEASTEGLPNTRETFGHGLWQGRETMPQHRPETGSLNLRRIDLVEVETAGGRSWFTNMAAGGNSGHLMETLTDEIKQRWGPLCYLRGAVDVLTELVVYEAALRFDDGPPQTYSALNIVLGNGRFSAGGLRVAPRANPEDGLLDAIIIRDGSPVDLMNMAAHYLLDDYVQSDLVVLRRARRVAVEAEPPIPFSADGDVLGSGPITFTVHPGALAVVVGPEYTPEPENGAAA